MAIWQDLVDTCGFNGSYQSVQRFVRKLHPRHSPEACAVIETAAGEECQVAYGTGRMVRDPVTDKYDNRGLMGERILFGRHVSP